MSKASKRGYNDFDRHTDPVYFCPYKNDDDVEEYLDGWRTARLEYEEEQKAVNEEKQNFENISYNCPWHDNYSCHASDRNCSIDTCAVWFFIKELK